MSANIDVKIESGSEKLLKPYELTPGEVYVGVGEYACEGPYLVLYGNVGGIHDLLDDYNQHIEWDNEVERENAAQLAEDISSEVRWMVDLSEGELIDLNRPEYKSWRFKPATSARLYVKT